MKKIKLLLMITLMFCAISINMTVYAYTIPDTSTHAVEVLLKANVPDDYTEKFEIAIYNEVTGETIVTEYMRDNSYSSTVLLPNKCVYHFMMMFEDENYVSDITESIELDKETSIEITFNITSREIPDNSPNADTGVIIGLENHTHSEEINTNEFDENTGLKTPDTIYNEFIEKTSFLNDSSNYNEMFLLAYTSDAGKEAYIKNTTNGNDESWNAMSAYEKFIYKELSSKPYLKIMVSNDTYKDIDEFMKEAYDIEIVSYYYDGMIPNRGQEVLDALEEVWRWQYNYFQITGTFFDFYEYKHGIMNAPTTQVQQMLEEMETQEELDTNETEENTNMIEELEYETEENVEIEEEESGLWALLKENASKNIVTLCLALILLIAFIVVKMKERKDMENN